MCQCYAPSGRWTCSIGFDDQAIVAVRTSCAEAIARACLDWFVAQESTLPESNGSGLYYEPGLRISDVLDQENE